MSSTGTYWISKNPKRKAKDGWKLVKQLTKLLREQDIKYSMEEGNVVYIIRW